MTMLIIFQVVPATNIDEVKLEETRAPEDNYERTEGGTFPRPPSMSRSSSVREEVKEDHMASSEAMIHPLTNMNGYNEDVLDTLPEATETPPEATETPPEAVFISESLPEPVATETVVIEPVIKTPNPVKELLPNHSLIHSEAKPDRQIAPVKPQRQENPIQPPTLRPKIQHENNNETINKKRKDLINTSGSDIAVVAPQQQQQKPDISATDDEPIKKPPNTKKQTFPPMHDVTELALKTNKPHTGTLADLKLQRRLALGRGGSTEHGLNGKLATSTSSLHEIDFNGTRTPSSSTVTYTPGGSTLNQDINHHYTQKEIIGDEEKHNCCVIL